MADRFASARAVADAVLYEGYVLYPYRASARKNQVRWQFGVLVPPSYADASPNESSTMQAVCLADVGGEPARATVHLRMRCLQVQSRLVEKRVASSEPGYAPVAELEVGERLFMSWDESVEQEIECEPVIVADLLARQERRTEIELPGWTGSEPVCDLDDVEVGRLVRTRWRVSGRISIRGVDLGNGLLRLEAGVENLTDWAASATSVRSRDQRDEAVRRSLVAVHILIALDGGHFVSLLDPPDEAGDAARGCKSVGCYPVLCGSGQEDLILASPIILYDHPEVAPESPGDMCDATEIDEILALRTLTLTDAEKREARATDIRSAAIVDRVDAMSPEAFGRLHGTIRSIEPAAPAQGLPWWDPGVDASVNPDLDTIAIGRHDVGRGTRVRLHPGRRSDAQDIFLVGRMATVAGVFHDVDGDVHLAVTIDDDPATELHEWYGRFRYFHPEELEVVEPKQ